MNAPNDTSVAPQEAAEVERARDTRMGVDGVDPLSVVPGSCKYCGSDIGVGREQWGRRGLYQYGVCRQDSGDPCPREQGRVLLRVLTPARAFRLMGVER